MRWLFLSAFGLAVVTAAAALGRLPSQRPAARGMPVTAPGASLGAAFSNDCPQGTLPDHGVCIPVPRNAMRLDNLTPESARHRTPNGEWNRYDQIPRRPDRPASYSRYVYPVANVQGDDIVSGYDLHVADEYQRRGPQLHVTGHGGVDIVALRGSPIRMLELEAQQDAAAVLYVGELFGTTVVTRHRVLEARGVQDYIVLFGHLDQVAPNLAPGRSVEQGQLVGLVGDSGSPGAIHLHLEIRQVRAGIDPTSLGAHELADNAHTVACDPRNLLPLRAE